MQDILSTAIHVCVSWSNVLLYTLPYPGRAVPKLKRSYRSCDLQELCKQFDLQCL